MAERADVRARAKHSGLHPESQRAGIDAGVSAANMSAAQAILILLDEVRTKTLKLLEGTPDECLLFAPAGTQNHILWHAGHAAWLCDVPIT